MKTLKKVCSNIYLVFIFVLLYAPILTLMVLSFNQSKSRARWGGFTTRWYTELFQNEEILLAFRKTMVIAFLSALVATLIGLCACMAMNNMKKRWAQRGTYRFFKCPQCRQTVRVPKGRGKICITCPKCKTEFIKKS